MTEMPGDLPSPTLPQSNTHPLISVWNSPGPTIKQIAATQPNRLFLPLAAVWGASTNLSIVLRNGIPLESLNEIGSSAPWVIVGVNALFGGLFGIVMLWATSFLFAWLGRLFGGRGAAREVRTVLAWSSVPDIPILVVAVLVIFLGGAEVLPTTRGVADSLSGHPLQLLYLIVNAFFGLFGLVVAVAGMSAVMEIGRLRALGVYVLGCVLIVALYVASALVLARLVGG